MSAAAAPCPPGPSRRPRRLSAASADGRPQAFVPHHPDRSPRHRAEAALTKTKRHGSGPRDLAVGIARSRRAHGGILGLAMAITLGGCAMGEPLAVPLSTPPAKQLSVWSAYTSDLGDAVLVFGLVRRPPLRTGPLWGHLHVEARFIDQRPPVWVDTRWSTIPPRGSRSGRFSARLPIADAASIASISVAYSPVTHRAR